MSFLPHPDDFKSTRPPSPPPEKPAVLPIRGPMRERYLRQLEEEKERRARESLQAERSRSVNPNASGLGFGPVHGSYYAYTRGAPPRGVFTATGTNAELSQTQDSDELHGQQTSAGGRKPCLSEVYAAQRIRHKDPILNPAPQALGYVVVSAFVQQPTCYFEGLAYRLLSSATQL